MEHFACKKFGKVGNKHMAVICDTETAPYVFTLHSFQ